MQNNKSYTPKIFTPRAAASTFAGLPFGESGREAASADFWRWGSDNLFPNALSLLARRSTTHRRIINDKADYISGKGFSVAEEAVRTKAFVQEANSQGETLREVLNRLAFDKVLFGNAFVEVVTDASHSFLALFHQDASRCRLAKDGKHVLLHHDWTHYTPADALSVPLYPLFEEGADGNLHTMIHYADYEPMFSHYGVPPYIAGLNVSTIAYKTDNWNIARLDNSFQLSGVMLLDGGVESEQEAEELVRNAQRKFAGNPGQVLFMVKDCEEGDSSRFIPITSSNEGDWRELHDQATTDIVIAHSWFRSLSGLDYAGGFSSERILHEWEVALNTVIIGEQEQLLDPLRTLIATILGEDASSLEIVNRPPSRSKPLYMRVWEARKADGLEYNPEDPNEQMYVAQVTKYGLKNID